MTRLLSAIFTALTLAASPAAAWSDVARVEVLPGWRGEDGLHRAAIRIDLAPGWKTYWRAPGDSGFPPDFNWSGSENVGTVAVDFPVPEVVYLNGMRAIVYRDSVLLPLVVTPDRGGGDVRLRAEVNLGVCEDICVPVEVRFETLLESDARRRDPAVAAAFADRPMTSEEAGVTSVGCSVEPIDDGVRVAAEIRMPPLGPSEVVVLEPGDRSIWVSEAEVERRGESIHAVADLVAPSGQPFIVSRADLRITVLSPGRAVDIRGCL